MKFYNKLIVPGWTTVGYSLISFILLFKLTFQIGCFSSYCVVLCFNNVKTEKGGKKSHTGCHTGYYNIQLQTGTWTTINNRRADSYIILLKNHFLMFCARKRNINIWFTKFHTKSQNSQVNYYITAPVNDLHKKKHNPTANKLKINEKIYKVRG